MELKATRFEVDGPVATIWLHRPHRHNAWTGRMHAEYRWLMGEVERDVAIRAVVVTGTAGAFCVGGDSDALAGHASRGAYDDGLPAEQRPPVIDVAAELDADFAFQFAMRVPVIAAVNGAAAGVGLAVALFADLRFVAAGAKLTTAAPKLGLPAEFGMSWVLPRLVGLTRASDLLLSGRVFTGAETRDWGLWNEVLADSATTLGRAREYAYNLAANCGPAAVAMTKRQLASDSTINGPAASIRQSTRLLGEAMATAEYREGVAALRDKRRPNF
ncbi:MAG: enoyl-CoA hydratase-related protein [Ilumatobacteraceae bacterium]